MKRKIIAANWKMHGSLTSITTLLEKLSDGIGSVVNADCVIFPPAIYIPLVQQRLEKSLVHWGAQNVYPKEAGAYTGEISGPMLQDLGCRYVLVGHSERRSLFHEDEKFVAEKFHHVKDHGMIPILCVGETLEERDRGQTEAVLTRQLLAIKEKEGATFHDCLIAYEPVWAIGTGQTPSPDQIQATHRMLKEKVAQADANHAANLSVLYGGSVNEKNASALFEMPDVDGALVGGASLDAKQFLEILICTN
ncbi:MAG: triose-phosphate isomerase [Legionella sp.]|nr:triose-phosphate isomerase [Legionella sp.]